MKTLILTVALGLIPALCSAQSARLLDATLAGNVAQVRELVQAGEPVSQARADGSQPIHAAAFKGNVDILQLLVDKGADVNARSQSGAWPLYLAAVGGHAETVRWLLAHGADPHLTLPHGENALFPAASAGNVDLLNLLAASGADVRAVNASGVTLTHAAITGELPAVEWAIQAGLDLNAHEADYGATPLHWAAFNKKDGIGLALIKAGADVHAIDSYGATPLHTAAMVNDLVLARALVAAGADVNAKTNDGATPLDFAARKQSVEVRKFLSSVRP